MANIYKNAIQKVNIIDGKNVITYVTYDRCKLYYNESNGSFRLIPWDIDNDKWTMDMDKSEWSLIGSRETTLSAAQPFTDIIDAMKYSFGTKFFTEKRVQLLWDGYKGKHDIFCKQFIMFFPRYGSTQN